MLFLVSNLDRSLNDLPSLPFFGKCRDPTLIVDLVLDDLVDC